MVLIMTLAEFLEDRNDYNLTPSPVFPNLKVPHIFLEHRVKGQN